MGYILPFDGMENAASIATTKLVEASTLCAMLSAPGLFTRKELVCFFVGFLVDWGNLIQG